MGVDVDVDGVGSGARLMCDVGCSWYVLSGRLRRGDR